jgi:signal transduction histidine kinase
LPELIKEYRENSRQKGFSGVALEQLLELPSELEQAAKRSRNIVRKLSFSSMSSKAHFEHFNILSAVNEAIYDPSLKSKIAHKISVINVNNLYINGDIEQITQVFINLLENANHATVNKNNSKIEILINDESVQVRDTGEGIDKYNIANIFDEHFSTKSTAGHGLAFCKRIMKNHGGTISCSSLKNEFTEFRLSFPKIENG